MGSGWGTGKGMHAWKRALGWSWGRSPVPVIRGRVGTWITTPHPFIPSLHHYPTITARHCASSRSVLREAERKFQIDHPLHWLAIRPDRRPQTVFADDLTPIKALEQWYDEEELREPTRLRPNTWKYKSNQRAILQAWQAWYGIDDWREVDNDMLIRFGGRGLLRYYPSAAAAVEYLASEACSSDETDHSYWKQPEHGKEFLDQFRDEQRLLVPLDWAQIDLATFREAGGAGLLAEGSLYEHLVRHYPEEEWGRVRPALDPSFWADMRNQRAFLDFLVRYYGLDRPEELISITMARITRVGGRELLKRYPSKIDMLRQVYPDHEWPPVETHHEWKEPRRHREFLEYVERVYGMSSLEDWRQVTARAFRRLGGSRILEQYGNLYQALRGIYGESRVPDDVLQVRPTANQGDLQRYEVRKRMVDELQSKLSIQHMEQWYDVTPTMMNTVSPRYHHALGHPAKFLPELFPHHPWDPFRFPLPHSYWAEDVGHHLQFMQSLERYHGIQDPVEWVNFLPSDFHSHPGKRCFMYYPSFLSFLQFIYPARRRDLLLAAPPRFWSDRANVESFLENVGQSLCLSTKFHWYTLSRGLLLAHTGGDTLLQQHGSLCEALRFARPTVDWHEEYFDDSDARSAQVKYLQCAVRHLFASSPSLPLECNYQWEGEHSKEKECVPLFLPKQQVIMAYHPPHWYDTPNNPERRFVEWAQQDKKRKQEWEARGYRYVAFPYWDPMTPASIRARLIGAGASDVEKLIVNQGRPNLSIASFTGPQFRKRPFADEDL